MGANNKISVLIEYIPSDNGSINYSETIRQLETQGNNISAPNTIGTAHAGGIKPFIIGVSKLGTVEQGGDGHVFWGDPSKGAEQWDNNGRQIGGYYGGFWGGYEQRSDDSGTVGKPVTFTIIGTDIDHFVIRFDKALGEYAPSVIVDGDRYENISGNEFIWNGVKSNLHQIKIDKWNKPNRQVKITSILIGLTVEYDSKYFLQGGSIKAGSRQTLDNTKPFSGVASQHGSFSAADIDGNIAELSQLDLLVDGLKCGVFMNAPPYEIGTPYEIYKSNNKDKMLGNYRLSEVSFVGDNLQANLVDDILNWGTTRQSGIEDDENNTALNFFNGLNVRSSLPSGKTLIEYVVFGYQATESDLFPVPHGTFIYIANVKDNITQEESGLQIIGTVRIAKEDRDYLKNTPMPDGHLPPSMLDVAWNIFCEATKTKISKNSGGDIWLTR